MCERANGVGGSGKSARQGEGGGVQVLPSLLSVELKHGGRYDGAAPVDLGAAREA